MMYEYVEVARLLLYHGASLVQDSARTPRFGTITFHSM